MSQNDIFDSETLAPDDAFAARALLGFDARYARVRNGRRGVVAREIRASLPRSATLARQTFDRGKILSPQPTRCQHG